MLYANQPKPQNDSPAEVKEPAAAYYTGRVGNAVAEPYETTPDDDYDYGAPESVTVHSYEELCQKLAEAEEDDEASDISLDDALDEILRDIKNGTI